ncbi:MAG: DUF2797 domain-containing protein [Saccharospirillum sp.]
MNLDLFEQAQGQLVAEGCLDKMRVTQADPVGYQLVLDDQAVDINPFIGQAVRLEYTGEIHCTYCGVATSKSYGQGYCYEHFMKLAQCDSCMMNPERCHFDQGTCREPEWGEATCMQSHYVYLANASGLKVGITRGNQIPTRWIDQGASQAMVIARVSSRRLAGLLEVIFKQKVADKTNWRIMLKGAAESLDLAAERDALFSACRTELDELIQQYGVIAVQLITHADVHAFHYPVERYPDKISSVNLDKQPVLEGTLLGIKGQYWILDSGVINIRRHTGYQVRLLAL